MINQSNIFKKIGYILNELQDQYQFLSENPEQLSELELELFLANANFLSDHVEIVKKLNNSKVTKELPQHIEVSKDDIIQRIQELKPLEAEEISNSFLIEEIEREELQQEDLPPAFEFVINEAPVADKFDFEEKSVEEMFDRTLSREEERIISEKQSQADSSPTPVAELKHINYVEPQQTPPVLIVDEIEEREIPAQSVEMVIDKVEIKEVPQLDITAVPEPVQQMNSQSMDNKASSTPFASAQRPTLNDLLAGKNSANNLAEESPRTPITDLKRAITLNEKLLYIKDLFNGYNLAYSEAIDLINKMPDFKTADNFLKNNYAVKNNWEAKQSTVTQFYELIKQRFPEY